MNEINKPMSQTRPDGKPLQHALPPTESFLKARKENIDKLNLPNTLNRKNVDQLIAEAYQDGFKDGQAGGFDPSRYGTPLVPVTTPTEDTPSRPMVSSESKAPPMITGDTVVNDPINPVAGKQPNATLVSSTPAKPQVK